MIKLIVYQYNHCNYKVKNTGVDTFNEKSEKTAIAAEFLFVSFDNSHYNSRIVVNTVAMPKTLKSISFSPNIFNKIELKYIKAGVIAELKSE